MSFCNTSMQTGILVLLFVVVAMSCFALFFTNKEVRNLKLNYVKNKNDIAALHSLFGNSQFAQQQYKGEYDDFEQVNMVNVPETTNILNAEPSNVNETGENVIPSSDIENVTTENKTETTLKESPEEESSEEDSDSDESEEDK